MKTDITKTENPRCEKFLKKHPHPKGVIMDDPDDRPRRSTEGWYETRLAWKKKPLPPVD